MVKLATLSFICLGAVAVADSSVSSPEVIQRMKSFMGSTLGPDSSAMANKLTMLGDALFVFPDNSAWFENMLFVTDQQHQGSYDYHVYETSKEQSDKLEMNAGVEGSYGAFSAAAHAASSSWSSSTHKSWMRTTTLQTKRYKAVSGVGSNYFNYLNEQHQHILGFNSPEQIVSSFGEFFPTGAEFGAALLMTYESEVTQSESEATFEADANATVAEVATVSVGAKSKQSSSERSITGTVTVRIIGGDEKLLGSANPSNENEMRSRWVEALNDSNFDVIRYTVQPIWRLLEGSGDEAKMTAVENYLKQKWLEDSNRATGAENRSFHPRMCSADAPKFWCAATNRYPGGRSVWFGSDCPDGCDGKGYVWPPAGRPGDYVWCAMSNDRSDCDGGCFVCELNNLLANQFNGSLLV